MTTPARDSPTRDSFASYRDSMPAIDGGAPGLRRLRRALAAADLDGDRTEASIVRRLQFGMALLSMPMIALWGVAFAVGGHWEAALWPAGYVVATGALVVGVIATGRFGVLRIPHTFVVAALPMGLHVWLGGFAASGGAAMWTLLVPIVATMFGFRRPWLYFLGVVVALALGALAYRPEVAPLTGTELNFHFALNTIGFTAFIFLGVRHFVTRIDAEKARAEGLLHRVFPVPIVRRLKRGDVIADKVEAVTVVFADLVGFTPLSARLPATEVVAMLDQIFTSFDALAHEHGVEKIKTIGDAYMAVAGAPVPCVDHAARAARLALAMRAHVVEFARAQGVELAMRTGLHSGPVVAGVIGTERFAYDLWGDTVNTASRMESHGQPDQVQITQTTRDALGDAFVVRERGAIEVKGRGTITTYWLDAEA